MSGVQTNQRVVDCVCHLGILGPVMHILDVKDFRKNTGFLKSKNPIEIIYMDF